MYSYIGTAGSYLETVAYHIAAVSTNLENMLSAMEQQVYAEVQLIASQTEALVSGLRERRDRPPSAHAAGRGAPVEIQTSMSNAVTEIQALRSHFDNYAALIENTITMIDSEMSKVPQNATRRRSLFRAFPRVRLARAGDAAGR